jgi:hypothetical protein
LSLPEIMTPAGATLAANGCSVTNCIYRLQAGSYRVFWQVNAGAALVANWRLVHARIA